MKDVDPISAHRRAAAIREKFAAAEPKVSAVIDAAYADGEGGDGLEAGDKIAMRCLELAVTYGIAVMHTNGNAKQSVIDTARAFYDFVTE